MKPCVRRKHVRVLLDMHNIGQALVKEEMIAQVHTFICCDTWTAQKYEVQKQIP